MPLGWGSRTASRSHSHGPRGHDSHAERSGGRVRERASSHSLPTAPSAKSRLTISGPAAAALADQQLVLPNVTGPILPQDILMQGVLKKKSEKGGWGVHVWNPRYCALLKYSGKFVYWKDHKHFLANKAPIGTIPIDRIEDIRLKDGRGKRFHLTMESGVCIFSMEADKPTVASQWVAALRDYPKGKLKKLPTGGVVVNQAQFWDMAGQIMSFYSCFHGTRFGAGLKPEQLRTFASYFTLESYREGQQLFNQRIAGAAVYIVISGKVKLVARVGSAMHNTAREQFLTVKLPGDTIDQSSVIKGQRILTAAAIGDTVCLQISEKDVREFFEAVDDQECVGYVQRMISADPAALLGKIPFLQSLPKQKLNLAGSLVRHVTLQPEEVLFNEGDLTPSLYIILQGSVKAVSLDKNGNVRQLLSEFIEGQVFGEISLLVNIPRTATVIAREFTLLLQLGKADFDRLMDLMPAKYRKQLADVAKTRTAEQMRKYKVPFFNSIPQDKYGKLAQACSLEKKNAGDILFREGDPGNCFYLIVHGELKVIINDKQTGASKEVQRMGPGEYLGEIALVLGTPRTATVECATRCVILSITADKFNQFFAEAPEAIADFEVKLARHDVQLRSVMYHPVGMKYLTQFLKSEYSEENSAFWMACRDYRHMQEHAVLKDRFQLLEALPESSESDEEDEEESSRLASASGPLAPFPPRVHNRSRSRSNARGRSRGAVQARVALDVSRSDRAVPSSLVSAPALARPAVAPALVPLADAEEASTGGTPTAGSRVPSPARQPQAKPMTWDDYCTSPEYIRVLARAKEMYDTFVAPSAPRQVNVIGMTQEELRHLIEAGEVDYNTYEQAADEIMALIAADSFARFKGSKYFKEFLEEVQSYTSGVDKLAVPQRDAKIRSGSWNQGGGLIRESTMLPGMRKQTVKARPSVSESVAVAVPDSVAPLEGALLHTHKLRQTSEIPRNAKAPREAESAGVTEVK